MAHHVVDGFDLGKPDDGCMRLQLQNQGSHVDYDMLSQSQMHDGEYAIHDDFEMADAEMMDVVVPADDRLSSYEGNRAYESDNDIEMSDIGMMDDDISADNAISPQGEDGENRVGEDADGNAINAAPAPDDYMSQYRIMFLVSQNMKSPMIMDTSVSLLTSNEIIGF